MRFLGADEFWSWFEGFENTAALPARDLAWRNAVRWADCRNR
jgi:hypothetical protein